MILYIYSPQLSPSAALMWFHVMMQNKIEEAEKKYKQTQQQLEGITQQVQELQPKCAELKAEAQRHNTLLKSSEVRFLICGRTDSLFHSHVGCNTERSCLKWSFIISMIATLFLISTCL